MEESTTTQRTRSGKHHHPNGGGEKATDHSAVESGGCVHECPEREDIGRVRVDVECTQAFPDQRQKF